MQRLLYCLLFLVLLQGGHATFYFEPDTIQQTILLPNYEDIERRVDLVNNGTLSNWTYDGNCTGINADLSFSTGAEQVLITFNTTIFRTIKDTIFNCEIEAINESGQRATLHINLRVDYDTRCSLRQNGTAFCESFTYSKHALCVGAFCECEENWLGWNCSKFCNATETCSGHGRCTIASYKEFKLKCLCDHNYFGENCSGYCSNQVTCNRNGFCTNDGTCECTYNYYGPNCEKYCDYNTCGTNFKCSATGDCECNYGHYGDQCQYTMCLPRKPWEHDCEHGKCNNRTGLCDCEEDYYGRWCDKHCGNTSCGQHGHCGADGECRCDPNYYTWDCYHYCGSLTCPHGDCDYEGQCHCDQTKCMFGKCDGDTCKCQQGYYGLRCDQQCHSCQNGLCDKMNGTCVCDQNYHAPDCSVFCNSGTTCSGHGECDFLGKCTCHYRFHGDDCSSEALPGWAWFVIGLGGFIVLVFALICLPKKLGCCSKRPNDYELLNNNINE